jgi:hypothetical protein
MFRFPRHFAGCSILLWLLSAGCATGLAAQNSGRGQMQRGGNEAVTVAPWHDGLQPLDYGWLEHKGDDIAWANPNFDDNSWQPVELDDLDAAQPGWRWYRLHLALAAGSSHLHLLIDGGQGIYELYLNGQRVTDTSIHPLFGVTRPREQVYALPGQKNSVVLALRTYAGGMYTSWHLPLFLSASVGSPGVIESQREALESQRLYATLPSIAINLLLLLAAIGALALWRSQRRYREYLWLGLYLFLLGTSNLLQGCASTAVLCLAWNNLLADPLIYVFTVMQIEFTFSFAGRHVSRLWRTYEAALMAALLFAAATTFGSFPSSVYLVIEAVVILPAALILPALLLVWYRGGNREAGWLILPSLFPAASAAILDLGSVSIYTGWGRADFLANPIPWGPVQLQTADLGDLLFLLAIVVVMFFRFTRVSREQARSAAKLDAAREMQQRLVPLFLPAVPDCQIEAAYRPAEEVGGDFYQVVAQPEDSTLIVIGDVSGKGLKAAMTGALALGALRALAAEDLGPAAVLTRLNQHLLSTQESGFVTCLCVQIARDGAITLANAGHLPPYRNGDEIPLEPSLPLGVTADSEYCETSLTLAPGDTLTLLSDGVIEATSRSGELFGFERTRQLSRQSAEQIAAAALAFGQQDDITVLTLRYAPAEVLHA